MEYDSRTQNEPKGEISDEAQHLSVDARYLLQPSWLRRVIQGSNGFDRFLLDYGFVVLPRLCLIIWSLFLLG
jgi:hypothetical protein